METLVQQIQSLVGVADVAVCAGVAAALRGARGGGGGAGLGGGGGGGAGGGGLACRALLAARPGLGEGTGRRTLRSSTWPSSGHSAAASPGPGDCSLLLGCWLWAGAGAGDTQLLLLPGSSSWLEQEGSDSAASALPPRSEASSTE